MRIRIVVEYDVTPSVAAKGYPYVRKQVRELIESWGGTFKAVYLSVSKLEKR